MVIFSDNVTRWERSLQDLEDDIEKCKKVEEKQMKEIDEMMRAINDTKNTMISQKHIYNESDEEINKVQTM